MSLSVDTVPGIFLTTSAVSIEIICKVSRTNMPRVHIHNAMPRHDSDEYTQNGSLVELPMKRLKL